MTYGDRCRLHGDLTRVQGEGRPCPSRLRQVASAVSAIFGSSWRRRTMGVSSGRGPYNASGFASLTKTATLCTPHLTNALRLISQSGTTMQRPVIRHTKKPTRNINNYWKLIRVNRASCVRTRIEDHLGGRDMP